MFTTLVVAKLLNVDRASLFLVSTDSLGNKKLVSQLFDIKPRSCKIDSLSSSEEEDEAGSQHQKPRRKSIKLDQNNNQTGGNINVANNLNRTISIDGVSKQLSDAEIQTETYSSTPGFLEVPLDDNSVLGQVALRIEFLNTLYSTEGSNQTCHDSTFYKIFPFFSYVALL